MAQTTNNKPKETKSIVIYFSRSGKNYVAGDIVNLTVGNTQIVAERLQKQANADIFKIVPVVDYPDDYNKCTEVAKAELNKNARPAYKGDIDLSQYDIIYLGYPIWWSTFPMCVYTFIEKHNGFKGKTVCPFATNEGSGLGHSVINLRKLCPNATVKNGVSIIGSSSATFDVTKIINQE